MLHKYSDVLGLPVVCVDSGKKAGTIKDIVFCPKDKEVKSFLLEHKGLELKKKVILLKDLLSLGNDAAIISDSGCISKFERSSDLVEQKDEGFLLGLHIFTKAGNELGIIKDVIFDWETGRIEGFEISDGILQDVINGRKIMPLTGKVEFAEENILVEQEAVEEMEKTGGGIKNRLFGEIYTKKE